MQKVDLGPRQWLKSFTAGAYERPDAGHAVSRVENYLQTRPRIMDSAHTQVLLGQITEGDSQALEMLLARHRGFSQTDFIVADGARLATSR